MSVVDVHPHERRIAAGKVVINLDAGGILPDLRGLRSGEVVHQRIGRAGSPARVHVQNWSQLRRVRERLVPQLLAGNRTRADDSDALPRTFVVDEVKGLVPDNRPADVSAEIIEAERRLSPGVCKEVARVERRVAEELKEREVNLVATRLGGDINV